MKRGLFVGLALLLWASSAGAQAYSWGSRPGGLFRFNVIGGVGTDSLPQPVRLTTTYAINTNDESRDRDLSGITLADISGTNLATAGACSTGVMDTRQYMRLKVLLKVTPRANGGLTRLAIQYREHWNGVSTVGDTANTFANLMLASQSPFVAAGAPDTLSMGHLVTGSATVPYSGEYTAIFTAGRNDGQATGGLGASPNGIAYTLTNVYGQPERFAYLSIRMRNLTSQACDYHLIVLGFAQ